MICDNDLCSVNIRLSQIEPRIIFWQYQLKASVVWIIRIHQVDYLWVKSEANICLRGVWKLGTFDNFLTFHYTVTTCKGPRKCHGTVMEKSLNFILGILYEPCRTSPALLFRMCCVSTAYQWRMGDAHAAHMAYEWRCHCVWSRVWELDHCVFTAQVAYAQRTCHEGAAVNAILWRMAGVCTAHGLRTCQTYEYTS